MAVEILPAPSTAGIEHDDDLNHIYCCNPDRSLCGIDISGRTYVGYHVNIEDDCVVCVEMQNYVCGARMCWLRDSWWELSHGFPKTRRWLGLP